MARILQIVTRLAVRGVPRHVLDLSAGLIARGHAVEVIAGRSEPGEGSLFEEARSRNIPVESVESLQRAVAPGADLAAFAALFRKIRQSRCQIVHTHISKAGVLGRLAARLAGAPAVVHTFHGLVEEVGGHSIRSRLFLAGERLAARASDRLIAVSQDTADRLQAMGIGVPSQYAVIRNGIDLERFDPAAVRERAPVAGSPLIGTIASLTPEKGVDLLLEAVPGLAARYPGLRLCLVGDGPLRPALQEQAQRLGVADRVEFAGNVAEVRPYLAAFDLFVLSSRREGMGRVLLEAMAMSCPVVATRAGGIPELVRHGQNGYLVPPEDPAALKAAICELLQDPPQREALGQAGREAVRDFGLEGMIDRVEELYLELLARKGIR